MRTLYLKAYLLALVAFLIFQPVTAQLVNQDFISPEVLRQGYAQTFRQTPDGKVYVVGDFLFHGERSVGGLVRLNADGSLDTSFDPQLPSTDIRDFEVLSNGNVVVILTREWDPSLAYVLSSSGKLLAVLNDYEGAKAVEPASGGRFILGDDFGTVTLFSPTFQREGTVARVQGDVSDIKVLGSQLMVVGYFNEVFDVPSGTSYVRTRLARFNFDGTLDVSFNANAAIDAYGAVSEIALQSDGKVIPLNKYNYIVGSKRSIRINTDGSVDAEFENNFPALVIEDASFVNEKLTVTTTKKIIRLNANGSVDTSLTPISFLSGWVRTLVLPDQSLILGNYAPALYGFAKFTSSGQRVNDYYARLMRYGHILSMERNANSIFIGGDFMKVAGHITKNVARLNLDGTVLKKFQNLEIVGPVHTVDAVAGAKVVVNTTTKVYRLESDGRFDRSFTYAPIPGLGDIAKVLVQPDGKILVGGKYRIFRLNANGSRDVSFNATVGISERHYSGKVDFDLHIPTGKIIFAAYYYPLPNGILVQQMARLNPDGSTDSSFNPPLEAGNNYGGIGKVIVLEDQKVLVQSSDAFLYNGEPYYVFKLNEDGSFNEEFMNNFDDRSTYGWYDYMARFGDRIVLSVVNPYQGTADDHAYFLDGRADYAFFFPSGMIVPYLDGFYADNSAELFVLGEIIVDGAARPQQIVKLTYAPGAMARAADSNESVTVSFYPNPVKDELSVNVHGSGQVKLTDFKGTLRISAEVNKDRNTLDVRDLPRGRYVIEVISDGKSHKEHLLKE